MRGDFESDNLNGRVLVWPDADRTEAGQDDRGDGALVEMLRDQVAYLRSQLDQKRQAHAETRSIFGGLCSASWSWNPPTHQSRENSL
jgi:hypothetical protein